MADPPVARAPGRTSTEPRLAPSGPGRRLPGEQGIWVFVLLDMSFFGLLFVAYTVQQVHSPELFAQAQRTLDTRLGLLNTTILLTSSWLAALAVHAARRDHVRAASRRLSMAAACGVAFGVSKGVEYAGKIGAGYSVLTDDFFLFYFVITFIHLLHVLAGTLVLLLMKRSLTSQAQGSGALKRLESATTYWHMVDLLWVMIFALLYLARWT